MTAILDGDPVNKKSAYFKVIKAQRFNQPLPQRHRAGSEADASLEHSGKAANPEPFSEAEIENKIRHIKQKMARRTAEQYLTNDGEILHKKRSYLRRSIYLFSVLLAVGIITAALLSPISPMIIGFTLLGAVTLATINYAWHSLNRAQTVGKGIAFGITAATVALLVKHVETSSLTQSLGGLLLPVAIVGGVSSFIANIVLYRNDVPNVLEKMKKALNPRAWQRPTTHKGWIKFIANSLVNLAIMSLSLASAYLLTSTMIHSFVTLFSVALFGISIGTMPYIVIPLAIIAFYANSKFMINGLLAIKDHFIKAWQYDVVEGNPLKKMWYYFMGWRPEYSAGKKVGKVIWTFIKLATLGAVAYISQIPLVKELLAGAAWASKFIVFTWLTPMMQALSLQAMIARVAITFEKACNVTEIVADKIAMVAIKTGNSLWQWATAPSAEPNTEKKFIIKTINTVLAGFATDFKQTYQHKCHLYMLDTDAKDYWQEAFGDNWAHYFIQEAKHCWQTAKWYNKVIPIIKASLITFINALFPVFTLINGGMNGDLSSDGAKPGFEQAASFSSNATASAAITLNSHIDSQQKREEEFQEKKQPNNPKNKASQEKAWGEKNNEQLSWQFFSRPVFDAGVVSSSPDSNLPDKSDPPSIRPRSASC